MKMEAIISYETPVFTTATGLNIQKDGNHQPKI
jgi:hypothetical protein